MDEIGLVIGLWLLVSLFLIVEGLVFIFKKDWVWRVWAWRHREVNPQRTFLWDDRVATAGGLLIIAGIGLGVFTLVRFLPLLRGG